MAGAVLDRSYRLDGTECPQQEIRILDALDECGDLSLWAGYEL